MENNIKIFITYSTENWSEIKKQERKAHEFAKKYL